MSVQKDKSIGQEKILEALSDLVPDDAKESVASAVSAFLDEAHESLESEYNSKLEEAYKDVSKEVEEAEKVAEEGYGQAYEIISDLRNRLEVQKEEFDSTLEDGYEEAYQMLLAERGKNESLEVNLYEEYDKKLNEIKEYMVDKVDEFLALKGKEFYEMAKKDVLNDPYMAEHKVALDKMLEVAADYLSDEDYSHATSHRIDELTRHSEELKGQQRILEAKNMRLSTEMSKLTEKLRMREEILAENANKEKKEREQKARTAEGRGKSVVDGTKTVEIVAETEDKTVEPADSEDRFITEGPGKSDAVVIESWRKLAGYKTKK